MVRIIQYEYRIYCFLHSVGISTHYTIFLRKNKTIYWLNSTKVLMLSPQKYTYPPLKIAAQIFQEKKLIVALNPREVFYFLLTPQNAHLAGDCVALSLAVDPTNLSKYFPENRYKNLCILWKFRHEWQRCLFLHTPHSKATSLLF